MTEDAAPFESHADDLARLRSSVNDLGGRTALERVVQRLSELVADNKALRKQLAERGSAEEARPGLESQSSLILDSIPGLVALLTATGDVEVVNRQVFEYFGQTLEELRQWGTNDTVHPEDLPHVIEVFTRSITSGSPYEVVQRFRRSDGVYRWFANSGFPVRDTNGHIVRWCVLLTDIDERKRAQDALRESEHESRLIVDSIPGLVVALAPDGEVEFVNRQGLEFFGQPLEELKHWGTNGAIHPEDLPRLIEDFTRAIASGCPFEWEVRGRRFDGVYRWFQSRGFPLRDASGRIIRWYNLLVDVDERKRAEEELRQAYARLAEAQRLTKTGSFVTDLLADRNWSEEIFRIFEFDPATKVTVQTLREVVHAEDQPLFDAAIARAMAGTDVDYVFRIVTSRGAVKHLRTTAHMIEPIAGRRLFVGALQDVTESKVAEDALNRARTELAHVARVATVSALTASIAHEVNQPLSGIITNASTCLRMLDANPPDVDGARETARRTIRDGNRASDVITRLRALFSKKEFALESLDLNDATREVIALSLSDLQRQRVVLQSEFANDLPKVTGDRVQLQQVILNLVRNASDAMMDVDDRPRQLLVRTERENGDRVRMMVRDSGVGVDRQSMDKLFDAFYTTKSGGMGIGLSVSRSIVERHQGRLWAEPNDGPGATFSFSIPLEPIPRSHGQWPTD
jgi:PAS domain S-box-containing protein